jgi:hypothetical protein
MSDPTQPQTQRAIRLIFEYEGDQVRLVSQQPVEAAVTGFDLAAAPPPGYYVETRDTEGQALARVPARQAFSASAEVFPEQPGEPITRVDVPQPRGAFTVIAPVPEAARQVAVVRLMPPDPTSPTVTAGVTSAERGLPQTVEIASFELELGS